MHDRHAFGHIVSAVAVNFCTKSLRIGFTENFFHFSGVVVHFCFYIRKAVDSGNNLSRILSESV